MFRVLLIAMFLSAAALPARAGVADTPAGWRAFVASVRAQDNGPGALNALADEMTHCVAFYSLFVVVAQKAGKSDRAEMERVRAAQLLLMARTAIITDKDDAKARAAAALAPVKAELESSTDAAAVNDFLSSWGNRCGQVLQEPEIVTEVLRTGHLPAPEATPE